MARAAVQIVDETTSKETLHEFRLELVTERLTARELLERRVRAEVDAYNEAPGAVFAGLVQPSKSERVLNGFRVHERRPLSAEAQVSAAVEAFERNGFLLLLDDRQIETLDEEVVIGPGSKARFVRLVPLMGG